MDSRLLAIFITVLIFFLSLDPALVSAAQGQDQSKTTLPSALNEDIFDDLPFEQRRQALRDEVARGSYKPKPFSKKSLRQYNLLIR